MKVIEIPGKPQEREIIRVAAYARVSADKEAAFHSLEAQTEYYEAYVQRHPDWQLVDIYSDNGISGTIIARPEFQRMLEDCRAGKIDLVITKSITRFARNTVILLETIRELKRLGIDCYFEKENMHSISSDGEFLLTLLATFAEEEARSASENQKWRIKKRFENGEPWVGRMLGYRLRDGKLEIVPEEAEIVQYIFSSYLSGASMLSIAKELNAQGILTLNSGRWNRTSIRCVLVNEKYTGDMILQKTFRDDFRTKKSKLNRRQVPMYKVVGSHEPIISMADFEAAQKRIQQNCATASPTKHTEPYLFTGVIRCGQCGSSFVRQITGKGKYKHPIWVCRLYYEQGKAVCPAQAIPEPILIEKTREVLGLGADDALDRELLLNRVKLIEIPGPNQLFFDMKDGGATFIKWQHRSRSESWTPEMRQMVRERNLKRQRKECEEDAENNDH